MGPVATQHAVPRHSRGHSLALRSLTLARPIRAIGSIRFSAIGSIRFSAIGSIRFSAIGSIRFIVRAESARTADVTGHPGRPALARA
jgi:hypothetical protein